ncbi:hypothetical protein [Nocardioides sp.]|uniref:hypothetical protein n=1 Tax=Nocardioides sp. TaxID=35761 RepID=UPI003514A38D
MRSPGARVAPSWNAVAPVLWVVCGASGALQFLVPWAREGLLADSSLADTVTLLRAGVVAGVSPEADRWWWLLLVPPGAGVVLIGCAVPRGAPVRWIRRALAAMVVLGSAGVWWVLGLAPANLGPAPVVVVIGGLAGTGAVLVDWRTAALPTSTRPEVVVPPR